MKQAMAVEGPDSGYSWVIVLCCSYIHFALFGLFRSAGVMYVALLQSYDVTREEASWPFSLCSAVFQLVGPAASVLTHYLSQRSACLLGSAIATVGVAGCYFAESVMWINIFYGIIHGLGFGLVVTLIPVILNQYFVKHRATAIGIAFSGGTISSFVFPVVMEWMLENYSLKGSFLLLSGMVMNTLVASSLLRAPPWLKKSRHSKSKLLEDASDAKDSGVSADVNNELKAQMLSPEQTEGSDSHEGSSSVHEINETDEITFSSSGADEIQLDCSYPATGDESNETDNMDTLYSNNDSVLFGGSNSKINIMVSSGSSYKNPENGHLDKNDPEAQEPLMTKNNVFIMPKQTTNKSEENHKPKSAISHSIVGILKEPMFHLITFTMAIYFLGIHSFFMVIVDFAKDKGISETKGIYIISMFSLTDLIGRAGLGWVTDRSYIKRKNMVILNLIVIGILNQFYPVIDTLSWILVIAAFHGLAVGCSITLFFVLQAEYMGMERLTLSIGLTSFINGALTLLRPAMTGLFRDVIGSYNWMFHFLGMISIAFSMIWLLESWMTRDKKSPNHAQDGKV